MRRPSSPYEAEGSQEVCEYREMNSKKRFSSLLQEMASRRARTKQQSEEAVDVAARRESKVMAADVRAVF